MTSCSALQIKALSLRPPVRVTADASLQRAASIMRRENISSLVVDTQPPSLLTERCDLVRAMADGHGPSDTVASMATRAPVWVRPRVLGTVVSFGDSAAEVVPLPLRSGR